MFMRRFIFSIVIAEYPFPVFNIAERKLIPEWILARLRNRPYLLSIIPPLSSEDLKSHINSDIGYYVPYIVECQECKSSYKSRGILSEDRVFTVTLQFGI